MLNTVGAIFCFCLFVAFRRIATTATELPRSEGLDEELHECATEGWALVHAQGDEWKRIAIDRD